MSTPAPASSSASVAPVDLDAALCAGLTDIEVFSPAEVASIYDDFSAHFRELTLRKNDLLSANTVPFCKVAVEACFNSIVSARPFSFSLLLIVFAAEPAYPTP